jgi:hypothetical protein
LGDSHALFYIPMLEQFSAEDTRTVAVLPTPGCGYASFLHPLDQANDAQCFELATDELRAVLNEAQAGDLVFLSSLNLPRLISAFPGGEKRLGLTNDAGAQGNVFGRTDKELDELRRAAQDAQAWIRPLVRANLRVVIEAPEPVFRAHPLRCIEWWNQFNPECAGGLDESRADLEWFRAPVMEAMARIEAAYSGVTIWDPMQSLCGERTCSAMRDGRPLFFDGDHLSPYGNLVLLDSFAAEIHRVEAN